MPTKQQQEAEETWRTFHKRPNHDWTKELTLKSPFPVEWSLVGRCVTTYYSSDKWQKDRTFFEKYYHDHNKKTQIWMPKGSRAVKLFGNPPPDDIAAPIKAGAMLGYVLDFDIIDPDGQKGKLRPDPGSLLLSGPKKKRLYVLEGQRIVALIWGPKLRVVARGVAG